MCAFWGSLIRNVRKTKGYSAESVCEGLCSLSTYKKMESSGYEPRKYLYDAVMERLGIDPLLFKCVYANSDEKAHIRKLRCLEDTSKKIKITCATDEQFQYCVEMFNENLSGATVNTVIDALRLTHPDFNLGDLERYLYTKEEVALMLIAINLLFSSGRISLATETAERLVLSLEAQFNDSYCNITQYTYAVILDFLRLYKVKKTDWIAEKLIGLMHRTKKMYGFEAVKDYMQYENIGSEYDAGLNFIYSHFGVICQMNHSGTIDYMKQIIRPRYLGFSESFLVRSIRRQNIYSQDRMRTNLISLRTLSRIERKESDMKSTTFCNFCKKYGLPATRITPYVVAYDLNDCLVFLDLRSAVDNGDYTKARALFARLLKRLDMTDLINAKKMTFLQALINIKTDKDSSSESFDLISDYVDRIVNAENSALVAQVLDAEEHYITCECLISNGLLHEAEVILTEMIESSKKLSQYDIASEEMLYKYIFQLVHVKNELEKIIEAKELFNSIYKKAIATENLALLKESQKIAKMLTKTPETT